LGRLHFWAAPPACQGTGPERLICPRNRRTPSIAPCPTSLGRLHHSNARRPQRRGHMLEFLSFINYVINLYSYVVFATVIMSFLLAFNVINPRNQVVQIIWNALTALTEPLLAPIRRALPDFGPIDLSPVVLLLGLYFIQSVVITNIAKAFI
jgi:YggT family protein